MNILVTGATGNIGGRVTRRLIEQGLTPRVLARDGARAAALFLERALVVEGDLGDERALHLALREIDAVFLVGTGPDLAQRDRIVALAARATGVKRIVKLSSLDAASPDTSDLSDGVRMGAWHASGEAAIRKSEVPWCFLRPTGFMSNALAWVHSIKQENVVRAPTGQGRIAMVHPDDIADVAVKALLTPSFDAQTLALTGPAALTYAEMIDILSRASGRDIHFEPITDEEAHARLLTVGMDALVASALVALWRDVRLGKSEIVTSTVSQTLGRAARTFSEWARENASAFK